MEKKNLFLFLLVLGTAFWGISFSVTKLAIGHHSSSTFLFYRFLTAAMVLSLVFIKHFKNITWHSVKTGVGLAVPLVVGIYMQTLGIRHTSASQCAFIAGTCVVIIPVLKLVFFQAVVPVKIWLAAAVALAGLFVISVSDTFGISGGDLYTLSGAFAFAVYLIWVEKQSAKSNLIYSIVPMFAACAMFTFLAALLDSNANWAPESNPFWLGIAFCSLLSTAYMYTVSNIAQRYISAERVAIIYLFEPVFGAVAAFFILGESLSYRLFVGGSLIFTATLISELKFISLSRTK